MNDFDYLVHISTIYEHLKILSHFKQFDESQELQEALIKIAIAREKLFFSKEENP